MDAVLDSCLMICVLFVNNCCKKISMLWAEIGAKRPNYGQNRTVWWDRLVRSDTVIWPTVIWTVLYGVIMVNIVITVQNSTLRHKCTGLMMRWSTLACLACSNMKHGSSSSSSSSSSYSPTSRHPSLLCILKNTNLTWIAFLQ